MSTGRRARSNTSARSTTTTSRSTPKLPSADRQDGAVDRLEREQAEFVRFLVQEEGFDLWGWTDLVVIKASSPKFVDDIKTVNLTKIQLLADDTMKGVRQMLEEYSNCLCDQKNGERPPLTIKSFAKKTIPKATHVIFQTYIYRVTENPNRRALHVYNHLTKLNIDPYEVALDNTTAWLVDKVKPYRNVVMRKGVSKNENPVTHSSKPIFLEDENLITRPLQAILLRYYCKLANANSDRDEPFYSAILDAREELNRPNREVIKDFYAYFLETHENQFEQEEEEEEEEEVEEEEVEEEEAEDEEEAEREEEEAEEEEEEESDDEY